MQFISPNLIAPGTLISCLLSSVALASMPTQGQSQDAQGSVSREEMWSAPTAEDWARPCLIPWQRNFNDALAVSLRTGRAILICVNMDGEIASEHYAGVRYRSQEVADLYEPYVTVIASVYRHTPRDHDEQGQRILCPRFGSVTCGEHIAIEPILYEQYFEGTRVSPRHIMIELDKQEVYDVYYAFDTASVFTRIRTGISQRLIKPNPEPEGDRSLQERLASQDQADRTFVETRYTTGDKKIRKDLLLKAQILGSKAPLQMLRLALFGLDAELASLARQALAVSENPAAIDLITLALGVPMPAVERESLLLALERLGAKDPRGKTLAVVHRGLGSTSTNLDSARWNESLRQVVPEAPRPAPEERRRAVEARVSYASVVSSAQPDDATAQLDLAEALLAMALDPAAVWTPWNSRGQARRLNSLRFKDAEAATRSAIEGGLVNWRTDTALALCNWYLGRPAEAHKSAAKAVAEIPPGQQSWNAMAVLSLFAHGRKQAIQEATLAGSDWPPEWLADIHAAYGVLASHPEASAQHVIAHYDFLLELGAKTPAQETLEAGLTRFHSSPPLHQRLRASLLRAGGPLRLEEQYRRRAEQSSAGEHRDWFAAQASVIAAEVWRTAPAPEAQAAAQDAARAAYARAEASYAAWIEQHPSQADSAQHFIMLSIAGRARVLTNQGELSQGSALILEAIALRPLSAASPDGLGISPVNTIRQILRRARTQDKQTLVQAMNDALERLEALDPALLDVLPNERGGPRFPRRRR